MQLLVFDGAGQLPSARFCPRMIWESETTLVALSWMRSSTDIFVPP
ncbi:MAG: hypothetical protein M3Z33_04125 [Actinomycetota bacterium]|nr:hypothetical protein [Actinomycetota bacterium]